MARNAARFVGNSVLIFGLVLGASILTPPFRAQSPVSSATRVVTLPDPVWFYVDGTAYRSNQTFAWPAGSKHILSTDPIQDSSKPGFRYEFSSWTVGGKALADGTSVAITADPALPQFEANFNVEVALYVSFFACTDASPCNSPGVVFAGGTRFDSSGTVWVARGGVTNLQAVPNPGYVFAGWATSANPNQVVQGFFNTVTSIDPMTVTAIFQPARPVQLTTDPPQLQLLIDRATVSTPATLDWGLGSTHTLGVISPQMDRYSKWWVFSGWSDGGAVTHAYKVANASSVDTVTATFSPATRVTMLTSPAGLKLKIDGKDNWPGYNFTWGIGETHTIEAPAFQVDAQGRPWQFQGWSDGLPPAHTITVPDSAVDLGMRVIATYSPLGRVTVTSNLPGLTVNVDGNDCATPCTVDRPVGASLRVQAPASLAMGQATRADFQGWADGSSGPLVVTASADLRSVAANYRVMNRLDVSADPAEGASCRTTPDSPDGYYETGTSVVVQVSPRPGFRFKTWDGDLSGSTPAGTVLMSAPHSVRAVLDRVPYIPPAGVRNGAGDGTPDGVAPGSIITISGANMTGVTLAGPDSPLTQTLGDVTVRIGDRLLPLFFVSPDRISAQLPNDLDVGTTTLSVRAANLPEVRATFTIVRDAPGLFQTPVDDQVYAVVTHENGKAVTLDAPARQGELLTVFGTGFGPTTPVRPLGFAVPDQPDFLLADAVTLRIGDTPVTPESSIAAPGRVGVDAVRFRLPAGLAGGAPLPLVVNVSGIDSNTVLLPLQ